MSRWEQKAAALWEGWVRATGARPPSYGALRLALAQAQFETACGDAWANAHNWGACDLRAPTTNERAAIAAGILRNGYWLRPDGTWTPTHPDDATGILQGDSDPNTGAFHVWFAAFPDDASGAAYFLRAGVRRYGLSALDAGQVRVYDGPAVHEVVTALGEAPSPMAYGEVLYRECYFGGVHPGARPCGHRDGTPTAPELANIIDYANALARQLPAIDEGLAAWQPPAPGWPQIDPGIVTDNAGPESAPTSGRGEADE